MVKVCLLNLLVQLAYGSPFQPHTSLTLRNLLLVPSITKNRVCMSKFAQDNAVYFEFHPTICFVKSQVTFEVLLQGKIDKDGLYRALFLG